MDLIPPEAIEAMAKGFTYGANKYSDNNWKLCERDRRDRIYAALQRHLIAVRRGEKYDPESHLSHLTHAITGLSMLLFWEVRDEEESGQTARDRSPRRRPRMQSPTPPL